MNLDLLLFAPQELFKRCEELDSGVVGEVEDWKLKVLGWKSIKSPSADVTMHTKYFPPKRGEKNVATDRTEGIIDCSAEEAAAFLFDYCSNERMRKSREKRNPARFVLENNAAPNEATFATVKAMPFLFKDREYVVKYVWRSSEAGVAIAFESVDLPVDYGSSLNTVRGRTRGLYRIENLPDRGQVKQCRCTFYHFTNLCGVILTTLMNRKLPETLGVIQEVIDMFRQDDKIDEADRAELATLTREKHEYHHYSEEELAILERGAVFFHDVKENPNLSHLQFRDPLVSLRTALLDNDSLGSGIVRATIDTTLEEAAAYEYLKTTREGMRTHLEKGGIEKLTRRISDHSQYYVQSRDLKIPGVGPREWRNRVIWKREGSDRIMIAYEDTKCLENEIAMKKSHVLASGRTTWVFEKLPSLSGIPQTQVTFTTRVDIAIRLPKFAMDIQARSLAQSLSFMRKKFDKR